MKKPIMAKTDLDKPIADLAAKSGHRTLGIWAADCAERVLPYFETKYPKDDRPKKAIKALRVWIKTGIFKMTDVREASLASHAAARSVKAGDDAARSAARAAGQAMATAHVPAHAVAAAIYAATAVRDATGSVDKAVKERNWQLQRLTKLNTADGATPAMKKSLWRSQKTSKSRPSPKKLQAQGVDRHIAAFPKKVRDLLRIMRSTIREIAPMAEETISYGIPTFKLNGVNLVHFAGYKNHIGFYPTSSPIVTFKNELTPYKHARGSVQFPVDKPIPFALVKKIVKFRAKEVS